MRMFYPLRPLTRSGRVLVCVAVSLFAAVVLVAWSQPVLDGAPLPSVSEGSHGG